MMMTALQSMPIMDILLPYMVGGGRVPLALNMKMYIMLGILFPHLPLAYMVKSGEKGRRNNYGNLQYMYLSKNNYGRSICICGSGI